MFKGDSLFGSKIDLKKMIKDGAIIIDVRTPYEFESGHIVGAVNIPVGFISAQLNRVKKFEKPIITCCRTGLRSSTAASILRSAGMECADGGAWTSLNKKI